MQDIAAIIAGAGAGTRLGANLPKALVECGGSPLIVHAVRGMRVAGIENIVVTVPLSWQTEFSTALQRAGLEVQIVIGGNTRQESVANALAVIDTKYVLVHDAARAFTPPELIRSVTEALKAGTNAVIPALPVIDTIKRGHIENESGRRKRIVATATLKREELYAVQTPQGFSRELLLSAHAHGNAFAATAENAATDDAALIELLGESVEILPGDARALKITTPFDLEIAELLAKKTATLK
ncbi:2-C-methyl-D-erythritol 4-phosphate cytidylyltransferase [Arcanobacterium hippocoleae]|uniref:2-C-methyl-D-erythritol 4-phosphate cytidylyltransferase n=1 Tax=Arcanobacterium hippocoleae TaxID=149017 RepID=A0ABU1T1V2_9ACTO|nr:2-C-methyl-D-erythritol 4-phosphate cytidylyltransferase [Arcanobacterium hippocoleae]MDR6939352.1 2-C-methyl-D-erythritol 4-phosphate cytidylyltransferase [Arcanobacterium hippocoleae]